MRKSEFVESYIEAWNHGDARLVSDHLAAGGTYCDIPQQTKLSRDELFISLTDFFASSNHRYELIGDILKGQASVAFQYRVVSPETSEDAYSGAEFVTLEREGAVSILDYYSQPGRAGSADQTSFVSNRALARKYAKSGLSDEQFRIYRDRLASQMDDERVFLQPDLTLPGLAKRMGCSVNHLSQVINSGFDMSFFDYLNHHRVEHAKQLLEREDCRQQSVLSIAFAAGFNSNSSFYAAFRKSCGQTPADYRRARAQRQDQP